MSSAPRHLPRLFKSVLQGERKLVVWGARYGLTVREWQRQVPALFAVDLNWKWWNKNFFHGLPICSPGDIEKLDPRKVCVVDGYAYAPAAPRIEDYLSRIGGYRALPPAPLHEMARAIAMYDGKKRSSIAKEKNFVVRVDRAFAQMLTPPADLHKKRRLPPLHELTDFFGSYDPPAYLRSAVPQLREENAPSLRPRAGHVCLAIHTLGRGGAERQICNLAVGLKRAGWTPTVLVSEPEGTDIFYRRYLADNGVRHIVLQPSIREDPVADDLSMLQDLPPDVMAVLWHMHADLVPYTAAFYKAIRRLRPALVVSYLDVTSTCGALAGLMAGVPRVAMSGRNLYPGHFLYHFSPLMIDALKDIYRLALSQPGISLNNNSPQGARSYAKWLQMPVQKIGLAPNCVTEKFTEDIDPALVRAKRAQLGLSKDRPLILGAFRLAPEKRPLDFVKVIAILRQRHPDLRAAICGVGPLEKKMRALVRRLKLEDIIRFLGNVDDMPATMRAATMLLHTAAFEGMPNVILEAQAAGLPVVSTDNAGVRFCLTDPWQPFLARTGDIKGLASSCSALLRQPRLRRRLAARSRILVRRKFSVATLTERTLIAAGVKE